MALESAKIMTKYLFFLTTQISNVRRSAPSGRIPTFDPPLDASGSKQKDQAYSGIVWSHFAPIFRKSESQEFKRVVQR